MKLFIYLGFTGFLCLQSCTSVTENPQTTRLPTQTVPTQSNSPQPTPSPDKNAELQLVMVIDANKGWSNIAFSPDGKTIASGNKNSFSNNTDIWDVGTGKKIRALGGHPAAIFSVTFSPDGKILVSTGALRKEVVKLWDVNTGSLIHTLDTEDVAPVASVVTSVAFSPDSKTLALPGYDESILLWNVTTGKQIRSLGGNPNNPVDTQTPIAFSPDGKILASDSSDNAIKLMDVKTGLLLYTLKGHLKYIDEIVFSPDGQTIASASADNTIKLWNVKRGILIRTLTGHSYSIVSESVMSGVISVAFSPDGKILASGAYDNTIKLWDMATGAEIRTIKGHRGGVNSVVFSPDGKLLASGSYDGTIKIWRLP